MVLLISPFQTHKKKDVNYLYSKLHAQQVIVSCYLHLRNENVNKQICFHEKITIPDSLLDLMNLLYDVRNVYLKNHIHKLCWSHFRY